MSDSTPVPAAAPAPDDPKKRLRDKVDKLLARTRARARAASC